MKIYDFGSDMTKALLMEISPPTVFWNDSRREHKKGGRPAGNLLQYTSPSQKETVNI